MEIWPQRISQANKIQVADQPHHSRASTWRQTDVERLSQIVCLRGDISRQSRLRQRLRERDQLSPFEKRLDPGSDIGQSGVRKRQMDGQAQA